MPCILMRKYALTWTAYKFLDIVVESVSHVHIAIDNRGNLMFIPHATWKTFIERRANRAINAVNSHYHHHHQFKI